MNEHKKLLDEGWAAAKEHGARKLVVGPDQHISGKGPIREVTEEEAREPLMPVEQPKKQRRGFAAMDPAVVRDIARRGGKAAQATGSAHRFTHDEAVAAGRKGGLATHAAKRERAADDSAPITVRAPS